MTGTRSLLHPPVLTGVRSQPDPRERVSWGETVGLVAQSHKVRELVSR